MRYFEIEKEVQKATIKAWYVIFVLLVIVGLLSLIEPSERLAKFDLSKKNYRVGSLFQGYGSGNVSEFFGSEIKVVQGSSAGNQIKYYGGGDYGPEEFTYQEPSPYPQIDTAPLELYIPIVSKPLLNQSVKFAHKVLPEYPLVALDEKKIGEVTALVYVGIDGKLKLFSKKDDEYYIDDVNTILFEIINEKPRGWFFADMIKRVITKWRFVPHIENGKPIPVFVKITWHFDPYKRKEVVTCTAHGLREPYSH